MLRSRTGEKESPTPVCADSPFAARRAAPGRQPLRRSLVPEQSPAVRTGAAAKEPGALRRRLLFSRISAARREAHRRDRRAAPRRGQPIGVTVPTGRRTPDKSRGRRTPDKSRGARRSHANGEAIAGSPRWRKQQWIDRRPRGSTPFGMRQIQAPAHTRVGKMGGASCKAPAFRANSGSSWTAVEIGLQIYRRGEHGLGCRRGHARRVCLASCSAGTSRAPEGERNGTPQGGETSYTRSESEAAIAHPRAKKSPRARRPSGPPGEDPCLGSRAAVRSHRI